MLLGPKEALRKRGKQAILVVLLAALAIAGFVVANATLVQKQSSSLTGTSSTRTTYQRNSTSALQPGTIQYTVDSPRTGQWLIIHANKPISSVSSSNTGALPAYSSLTSLNSTLIGEACGSVSDGGQCSSWQYIQQTGWYWDQTKDLLYIHYLGGDGVVLTVSEK